MIARVGFVGLGAMGEPMARSLRRAGFDVTASVHRHRDALERLRADGVEEPPDPATLARGRRHRHLRSGRTARRGRALRRTGVAAGSASRPCHRHVHDLAGGVAPLCGAPGRAGIDFVDAPVSGGPARARDGTLTIMVGASPHGVARAEPVLRAMGTPHHLGPVGMGETVKLVNQIIIANVMIANAEAWSSHGAPAPISTRCAQSSRRRRLRTILRAMVAEDMACGGTFEGGFALDRSQGPRRRTRRGSRHDYPMPATGLAYQLYTTRSAEGDGALDYSAIVKAYEWNAETKPPRKTFVKSPDFNKKASSWTTSPRSCKRCASISSAAVTPS